MKFVIATQELNYLVTKCLNIIPLKATVPILNNFLIEARGNELTIVATDLKVAIRCITEAKILEEGATTVPARRFAQLVRELTASNIEVSTNENEVMEILADSSRFKLNGMNRNEFPAFPTFEEAVQVKIAQDDLKDMLFRTSFAVSKEDNRYALTGVFMHIQNGEAVFTGTDGKRLARTRLPIGVDPAYSAGYIIPLKAVEEIQKNLDGEGEATLYLASDKLAVSTPHAIIVAKLLTGEYPDVSRVIPEKAETTFTLHREELMTLLRQTSLFTAEASRSVRFTFANGEVKLNANNMEVGEGKVSMPADYHGEQMEIAFNPDFFLDILKHSKGETVMMGVIDSYNPGLIVDQEDLSEVTSDATPLYILMPMRLNED